MIQVDVCECGREIVHPPTGRRRQRCETCAPTKPRNRVVSIKAPGVSVETTLAETVRDAIVAAGREGTVDGAAAIYAAEMLIAGGATAAAAASLLKEMRAAAADALKGADASGDLVDDLKKRRASRRGA